MPDPEKPQPVRQSSRILGMMEPMTNRNSRSGKLAFLLVALAVLARFQPGFAETQGIEETRKVAEQGDAEAQSNLASRYLTGDGVPEDPQKAAKWYRQAAEQGHAEAQRDLGWMYRRGYGVPQDDREAAKWYRLAAEQGQWNAQLVLGLMYDRGQGVPQNHSEAAKWVRKSALQGFFMAQEELGTMYAKGEGVPQDFIKAYAWFSLAAGQGYKRAIQAKNRLRLRITGEQAAEAQKMARELHKRIEEGREKETK